MTCPEGTYPTVLTAGTGGAVTKCAPRNSEDWYCTLFGLNCQGPPALREPGAPKTVEQLTVPGTWTPKMSADEAVRRWQQDVKAYVNDTPGIAFVPSYLHEVGEEISSNSAWIWLALGAAGAVGALILIRRI